LHRENRKLGAALANIDRRLPNKGPTCMAVQNLMVHL
jgi:hypothetical protein